ncbi:Dual-specificity kinase, spindle pole body (SPB) duplication and spindle checkpoint function [Podila epigama]|nr:Dual-specificity kinase, spindle pole body (SPB) duplication and spindle checkpoint function [Podila epigama]
MRDYVDYALSSKKARHQANEVSSLSHESSEVNAHQTTPVGAQKPVQSTNAATPIAPATKVSSIFRSLLVVPPTVASAPPAAPPSTHPSSHPSAPLSAPPSAPPSNATIVIPDSPPPKSATPKAIIPKTASPKAPAAKSTTNQESKKPSSQTPQSQGGSWIPQNLIVGAKWEPTTTTPRVKDGVIYPNPSAEGVGDNPFSKRLQLVVNERVYARVEEIGRGGSSRVYKVMAHNGHTYAIKRVTRKAAGPEFQSYQNEVGLLKTLSRNRRIVRLWDADVTDTYIHMLMELGEIDLARLMAKKYTEPFDIHFIGMYWRQMLESVQAIHEVNIVHSDLKPANFVLVQGSLKLIDFGIAKTISNDTTNIHREECHGTSSYMPPEAFTEIAIGNGITRKLGRSADVWSLGCIIYQMVYGYTPFSDFPKLLQRIKAITDPNHGIAFPLTVDSPLELLKPKPTESDSNESTFASSSSSSSKTPPTPPIAQRKVQVGHQLISIMKGCLARQPKERKTIPELLNDPFITQA